ncbi:hypothetical protein ACEWY4_008905 [Coilia grayii]|uniref:K Homology domain-containing protein n=1 Tax=Coilia grayii TaxID=363190 RepID=A0ABD1K566_9TELE
MLGCSQVMVRSSPPSWGGVVYPKRDPELPKLPPHCVWGHSGEEGEYFLKVLIPSYAAGSIIGKGGQTIVQLQKETGATIKLSKSKDFYPGVSSCCRGYA